MLRIEIVQLGDLKTGDKIAVMGEVADLHSSLLPLMDHTNGIYFHHGIFDKENLEVIELQGDDKASARPKRRPILQFTYKRYPLYRVVHERCLPVETTMKMANEAVEKQDSWPGYNLIQNNCETFATYLKTGHKYSEQVASACKNFLLDHQHELSLAASYLGACSVRAALYVGAASVRAASYVGAASVGVGSVGAVVAGSIAVAVVATGCTCFAESSQRAAQTESE